MVNSSGDIRSGSFAPSIIIESNAASTTVATVMASVIAISTAAGFVFLNKKKITKFTNMKVDMFRLPVS